MKRNRLEKLFLHMIQATGSYNGSAPDVVGETKEEQSRTEKKLDINQRLCFKDFTG